MDLRPILLLLAFMATAYAACSDQTLVLEGATCSVKQKQMKVSFKLEDANDSNKIDFDITSVKELDKDKKEVGKSGKVKHSMENAKSDDFCAETPEDGKIPNSDVPAKYMKASGSLTGLPSTITAWVYIAKEDGNITIGNECFPIKKGQVKISFELSNWTWCCLADGAKCEVCKQGATNEVGEHVEVEFVVKTPGSKEVEAPTTSSDSACPVKPDSYKLYGGANIVLSMKVKVDNKAPVDMSPKPTLSQKGSKTYLKFTCPKFDDKCIYDPTCKLGSTGFKTSAATMATICLSLLALLFVS